MEPRKGRWPDAPMDRCFLNVDSPSYPPEASEYAQCDCAACRYRLTRLVEFSIIEHDAKPKVVE